MQMTHGPVRKKAVLTSFYTNLFTATEKQATLPEWADLEKKFRREDLDELPRIDGPLLRKAISLFKNNKSCAADRVVAEMLSALDEDLLETLAEAFSRRTLNNEERNMEGTEGFLPRLTLRVRPQTRQAG